MPEADFATWQRDTLERFARQAADENRELRERVAELEDTNRMLLREWRAALAQGAQ
jgi:hypothetical protein